MSDNPQPDEEIIKNLELLLNLETLEDSDLWEDLIVLSDHNDLAIDLLEGGY